MPYRPRSPPHAPTGPNGITASVATAVKIDITGAIAIIHGTAVAGVECSLEISLSTSAMRLHQPVGPDAVGPVARLEAPEQLALEQQDHRDHAEDEGEDHDRLQDQDAGALHQAFRTSTVVGSPPLGLAAR